MAGNKGSRKQRHRKTSMHPNGNGSGQIEKEKMGGGQPTRETSVANLGSKVNASQLASASTSQSNEAKIKLTNTKKKQASQKQQSAVAAAKEPTADCPSQKRAKDGKEKDGGGVPTIQDFGGSLYLQDQGNSVAIPGIFENQSATKPSEAPQQQMSTTSQKAKAMFIGHRQKSSAIKISPAQNKGQKLDKIKAGVLQGGQHHSSFGQHKNIVESSALNSQLSGYYVNGQNFQIHLTQTPVVIKSKTDGLIVSSISCNGGGSGHPMGGGSTAQQIASVNNYKTPMITSTIKSHGLEDSTNMVSGHLISDLEGNMIQQSLQQNSHGFFNSHGKNKHAMTSFARESLQFTPRRIVSGLPMEDSKKMAAAYIDTQKSTSTQPHRRHNLNAVLVQNSYYNKAAGSLMYNHPHFFINQEMMIQGKNTNQIQHELSKVGRFPVKEPQLGMMKNGKQLAQSQDARPLTGQEVKAGEGYNKQAKSRLESGTGNKSTHILLPHKEQQQAIQQHNARAANKIQIGLSKHVQKNRNEGAANHSLVMSAPRVVALAAHHGLNAGDEKPHINLEMQDAAMKQQLEANAHVKPLNTENYKSLQVNRSNTTTGYIAGVKTQVQLSQNLQHATNSHLTHNGMSILANGAPPTMAVVKQSYADEAQGDSSRLRRESSENNMSPGKVPFNNKNAHVRKLVSNFKVQGKKATDVSERSIARGGKVFQQKRNSQHQYGGQGELPMGTPEAAKELKDYPGADPSRNMMHKAIGSTAKNMIENTSQSTKDGDLVTLPNKEAAFQIQPTIVFSAKTAANQGNPIMNTVDDEIFQNNGRQIAEGYNSYKMSKLLGKEHSGSKSKPSIGIMPSQNHQLNMQLFEMQFLKGQDHPFLDANGVMHPSNPGARQAPGTKEMVRPQQSRSPSKGSYAVHPKASLPQTQMLKNQAAFGGYSHNASKPSNLIYSVHHHMQNAQDPLNGTMMAQNTVTGASMSFNGQTQNGVLYHKPANSSSFLALQNQSSATVRQDQLILSSALKTQHPGSHILGAGQPPPNPNHDKKMLKMKDMSNITSYTMLSGPDQHEDKAASLPLTSLPNSSLSGQQPTHGPHVPVNLILQHKTLAKGSHAGTTSNTQLSGSMSVQTNATQRQPRLDEAQHLLQMGQLGLMQGTATAGMNKSADGQQTIKGTNTLQQAIQNLWSEQEKIVAEIFASNKHIDPNSLNLIIQSQLNQVKPLPHHGMLGSKFITPYRNTVALQTSNPKQGASQAELMNSYKTQLEGLQALKSLQDFLEFSANQNVSQILQNRSKFLMSSGLGGAAIPHSFAKQLSQAKKPPTDLYGNPINLEKQKSKIPFENAYVEDCYKYIVLPGNNSQLIRKALERRSWWIEIQPVHSLFNFRWQPVSHGIRFDRLSARQPKHGENYGMGTQVTTFNTTMGGGPQILNEHSDSQHHKAPTLSDLNSRQVVNHVEYHHLITEKFNLLHSMQKYCDLNKENVFDFLPVTFYIEMPNIQKESAYNSAMQPFIQYFQVLDEQKEIIHELKQELVKLQEKEEDRERQLAEQREQENGEDGGVDGQDKHKKEDGAAGSESDTGADGDRHNTQEDGLEEGEAADGAKKEEDEEQEAGKKKEKGLLSSQPGYSTVYKTPGKDNPNNKSTKFKSFNFEKRNHMRLTCPVSHFDGHNLWLLKPTHLNRGRGIHVFNDLGTLHKLIREYCIGKDEESWKKKSKIMTEKNVEEEPMKSYMAEPHSAADAEGQTSPLEGPNDSPLRKSTTKLVKDADTGNNTTEKKSGKSGCYKIKHNTFIIQKYIERPLLICDRKFDIRVWVLLDHDHNVYFFKEGYIRTSASIFSIDSDHIDNAAVHLTNNAVQKALDSYGQFEDGNQLSFDRFQELLLKEQPDCGVDVRRDLVPAMKHLIQKSLFSVRKTIDPFKRKYCFELFGYDFILDEDFNTWLIEVNTNPCLEESSQMLKLYLPRMIEDMLKITVDQIFPKISKKKRIPIGGSSAHKDHGSPVKLKNRKHSMAGAGHSASKHFKGLSKISKHLAKEADKKEATANQPNSPKNNAGAAQADGDKLSKVEEATAATEDKLAAEVPAGDQIQEDEKEHQLEDSDDEDPEKKAKDLAVKYARRIHPVPGYGDSENMWEKLLNLEKTAVCPPQPARYCNNKNRFNIAVQEKIFKIKKNPAYTPYHKQEKQIQQRIKSADGQIDEAAESPLRTGAPDSKAASCANESLVASAQIIATSKLAKVDEAEEKKGS